MKFIITAALGATLLLTGCSQPQAPAPDLKTESAEKAPAKKEAAAAGTGAMPEWAAGSVDVGEKIGSTSSESWQVDIYQVGTGKTSSDSMFVDPDTNENILPAGSEVVFLNFVYTNISDETISVGSAFGMPDVRVADWPYMGGMPGESLPDEYETLGLANNIVKVGAIEDFDNIQLPVAPGQSVPAAVSIKYTPGSEAFVYASMVPVDADGDLDHDRREEVSRDFTFTIN